jgi:hypothetical protein
MASGTMVGRAEVGNMHADLPNGWLRPAVFGVMDGLVTNIALVAGVGGGGAGVERVSTGGEHAEPLRSPRNRGHRGS